MEVWKDIEGFENKYQISNNGRAKSLIDKHGHTKETILKPRKANNGYLYVNLYKNSKCKTKRIHRLVAETFIDNSMNLPQVNHIDGNKENNNVNNLEWMTASDNLKHAIKTGLKKMPMGKENYMYGRHGKDNPHSKPVLQYDMEGKFIKEWDNVKIASETLKIHHIDGCCRKERKSAGGYSWKYKVDDEK